MFGWFKKKEDLFQSPLSDAAGTMLAKASARYLAKQADWERRARPDEITRWGFEQTDGVLTFERDSRSTNKYKAQILGSYHEKQKEWEWAWNNPNVKTDLAAVSSRLRDLGTKQSIPYLTQGQVAIPNNQSQVFLVGICVGLTDVEASYLADANDFIVALAIEREL